MADFSAVTKTSLSGRFTTAFHAIATEASVSHLFEFSTMVGGDNTAAKTSCYIEWIQLSCGSAGSAHVRDGSAGESIVQSLASGCQAANSQEWDYGDDPLVCLTAVDNTSVIAIDMTVPGEYQGVVKYHFGPPPTS